MKLYQTKCACCHEVAAVSFVPSLEQEIYCPPCAEAMLYLQVYILKNNSFKSALESLQERRGTFTPLP